MSAQDGGPAFPGPFTNDSDRNISAPDGQVVPPGCTIHLPGISMRDYFAAMAMQALIQASTTLPDDDDESFSAARSFGLGFELNLLKENNERWHWSESLCFSAYEMADEMLRVRKEK